MSASLPLAPSPLDVSIPVGTRVALDPDATFVDRELLSGGSPWRLLRLPGASREVVARWQDGDVVRAGEERLARTLVQQGFLLPSFEGEFDLNEVDVVVPVYDGEESLRALLSQLRHFHVTVVDDGSSRPEEIARCCSEFDVALVRLEDNRGPAAARNAGTLATSRPYLWFVDVDVDVDDAADVATKLGAAFDDPLVAAVAPRVQGTNGPTIRERFEHHFGALDKGERSGLVVPGGAVNYVPSAVLMVRREAFGDGFDETLRVGEDVDLVWRLSDAGWLVRYDATIVVSHSARNTWQEWWHQRQRYGASSGELARRYGVRLAPLRSDPWTLLAWVSVLFGQAAIGARVVRAAERHASERLFLRSDEPTTVARNVVGRNMVRSGGPLARAVVRTFGVFILTAALHPRLRRRAILLFAAGSAWRWRRHRVHLADIPVAIADDLAYGIGVVQGAMRSKTLVSLTPKITKSNMSFREVAGIPAKSRGKVV